VAIKQGDDAMKRGIVAGIGMVLVAALGLLVSGGAGVVTAPVENGPILTATGTSGVVLSLSGTAQKTLAVVNEATEAVTAGSVTYWGAFTPTGTVHNWRHLYRMDTLAPAQAVSTIIGSTNGVDRITTSGNYKTGIVLYTGGPVTHVQFTRTDTGAVLYTTFTGN